MALLTIFNNWPTILGEYFMILVKRSPVLLEVVKMFPDKPTPKIEAFTQVPLKRDETQSRAVPGR
jgi:hypothetical protein